MSKKRATATGGDLTPSQFEACLEKGLNISTYDRLRPETTVNANTADEKLKEQSLATATGAESNLTDPVMQPIGETEAITPTARPNLSRVECTNGAMEALRLCHSTFLITLSSSLRELQSNSLEKGKPSSTNLTKPLSENDIATCMGRMGLWNILKRAITSLSSGDSQRAPRKKRKKNHFATFKRTQEELITEQETLLAESAHRVQMMRHQQLSGKNEQFL